MKKIVIRLKKKGTQLKPMYDIVVTYAIKRLNTGLYLEKLGYYSPSEVQTLIINYQRLGFWLNRGAQLNDSVKKCIAKCSNMYVRRSRKQ